jgi:hypothetical protein
LVAVNSEKVSGSTLDVEDILGGDDNDDVAVEAMASTMSLAVDVLASGLLFVLR